MKNLSFRLLLIWGIAIILNACNNDEAAIVEEEDSLEVPPVRIGNFYETDLNSGNSILLADTIAYDVTIKSPDPEDEWWQQDVGKMDELALANIIFNAIYNKRLVAYDYQYEVPLTIDQVRDLEKRYPRESAARMRFVEEWYFDEKELEFGKRVNSIMIAYEKINESGDVKYYPGVLVYLRDSTKNVINK